MLTFQHSLPQMIPFLACLVFQQDMLAHPLQYLTGRHWGSKDVSGDKLYRIHWMPLEQRRLRVQTIGSHMCHYRVTLCFHLQIARNCLKIYQGHRQRSLRLRQILNFLNYADHFRSPLQACHFGQSFHDQFLLWMTDFLNSWRFSWICKEL